MICRQRGIALLQVLFLSLILSVMLISVHLKAKQVLDLAQQLSDRHSAELAIYSADSEFRFIAVSQPLTLKGSSDGTIQWNLYDEPFEFSKVSMQVQDITGLVNLHNSANMTALFEHFTSKDVAVSLSSALQDWQDEDNDELIRGAEQSSYQDGVKVRNRLMQTESEIRFLKGMSVSLASAVMPYVVSLPQNYKNPFAMPETVLEVNFGKSIASQLLRLRQAGQLSESSLQTIAGVTPNEEWGFYPSGSFRVTFTSQVNNVKLSRRYTIRLSPYQEDPFTFWEYLNQYHAENRRNLADASD